MMFSSISVTVSSLALRWVGRPKWLDAERLESEGKLISAPIIGAKHRRKVTGGVMGSMRDVVGSVFDSKIMKRRTGERERGAYVPLQTVEGDAV